MDGRQRRFTAIQINRYHVVMAIFVCAILVVSAVTIFTSNASVAQEPAKKKAIPQRLVESNDVDNPPIVVDCDLPILTVALTIDRSASVVAGGATASNTYKKSVNNFLARLNTEIVGRGGKINILLYAFASRSVAQNNTVQNSDGTAKLVTSIPAETSLEDIQQVVDHIFFTDNANTSDNDPLARSQEKYDLARGYNPGLQGNGSYGATNWDDALLDIKAAAESPAYNSPFPGKHIDLALMLTDGIPNLSNGTNREFDAADTGAYAVEEGRSYSKATVEALRRGQGSVRPPMAVRGILINSGAEDAMREVFGEGSENYSTADGFDADLKTELDKIIKVIVDGDACAAQEVTPSLSVSVNPSEIGVSEGSSKSVTITVSNTSAIAMKDVKVSVNGSTVQTGLFLPAVGTYGSSFSFPYVVDVGLGEDVASSLPIVAEGKMDLTSRQKLPAGIGINDTIYSPTVYLKITVDRTVLPS